MTRRRRLVVWIVVVIAVLASPAWFVVGGARIEANGMTGAWAIAAAGIWQSGWLVVMAWLLATTPGDAIRLPRRASWAVLVAGVVWFAFSAWWLGVPVLLVLLFALLLGVIVALDELCGMGRAARPWTAAVFLWSPFVWLMPTGYVVVGSETESFWWLVLACLPIGIAQLVCVRLVRRAGDGVASTYDTESVG